MHCDKKGENITEFISKIVSHFPLAGRLIKIIPIIQGHINTTYRLITEDDEGIPHSYALQAINQYVFKNPEEVMENICAVTAHLHKKILAAGGNPEREALTVIYAKDGKSFHIDERGEYWRIYHFIRGASTYDTVQNARHLYNAGYAFGRFQTLLADFPIHTLKDTIPDFHNTKKRMADFFAAVEKDECGRVKDVLPEIEFFRERANEASRLVDMQALGLLPLRVTHNDTKYNNIMIDDETGEALCVIDLDTVMPGLAAYDYGDAIRFAASTAAEDETDLSLVNLDMHLFEQFTAGFVGATTGFLTKAEIENLPWGARLITLELASRFLKDHLEGDKYFRIHRENHNLDRARNQMKLVLEMEKHFDEMCAITSKYM
ncbi:MAG TPA: aminoglycoside phosphotransferase family protein [Clostridiales bacterium]|nr:aminoglycoside phosphotransferase family protein [Clostridiales bacterium]